VPLSKKEEALRSVPIKWPRCLQIVGPCGCCHLAALAAPSAKQRGIEAQQTAAEVVRGRDGHGFAVRGEAQTYQAGTCGDPGQHYTTLVTT